MPQAFENCKKQGGKIKTVKLGGGKHRHICYLNGKAYPGYVMNNKDMKSNGKKKYK